MATSSQYGTYINTTFDLDVAQLQSIDVKSPEFKELLVRLYQNLNNMVNALNIKDTGIYNNSFPIVCGQQYFPNPINNSGTSSKAILRNVNRLVINFGVLPNTTTKSVPHGIIWNSSTSFTRIYATSTFPSNDAIPIPYASATTGNIVELYVDTTNVNITTNQDMTAYTVTYVILEWLTN